jgi:glycosyltransferase involved in cell wall biosynthesis
MRHAMTRLYRLLGIDVSWYVLKPNAEIFNITKKKFHNVLQGVAPHNCVLEESEKRLYNSWISDNANFFKKIFKDSDVIVIDDPQPAGLIPHIKKINPQVKIFYRSHIQIRADLINTGQTQQLATWKFLWQFIKLADIFISHPISEFVPNTVKKNKLLYLPPSTDPFDGLNKNLKKIDRDYYLSIFQKHLKANEQKPLDTKRPYIVQIARFDPSKGIHDVIESYRKLCLRLLKEGVPSKKLPQLVIAGNGSVDDPEGVAIYEQTSQMLQLDSYANIVNDIKIARLPHCDQLLNTLLDNSLIALQLSHKEGFEFKVTEALIKGKPVIAYKSGGIPLQIRHGYSGFLVDIGNTSKVADYAKKLILDKKYYKKISQQAKNNISHDYLTLNNCAKWLDLVLKFKK